jgi:hypothetical protein
VLVGGLVGEYFADHKKKEYPRFKKHKRLFEQMVIIGVLGELLADGGIFSFGQRLQIIADGENARLYIIAKQAGKDSAASYERAGIAELKAGEANERAANSELKVEELRKQNAELTIRLQPRRITQQQRDKFIELLKNSPKFPVKIFVGRKDTETDNYAKQMREMLNCAGFGIGEDEKIRDYGDFFISLPVDATNEKSMDSPIFMVLFGEPNKPIDWPGLYVNFTTTQAAVTYNTNDISGFGIINAALQQIGIIGATTSQTNWFVKKPGDWCIFIPQKF